MESGPLTKLLALPPLVAGVVKMFVLVVVRLPVVIVSVPPVAIVIGRLSVTPLLFSIVKFDTVPDPEPLMVCADVPAMRKVPFVIVPVELLSATLPVTVRVSPPKLTSIPLVTVNPAKLVVPVPLMVCVPEPLSVRLALMVPPFS